jgi:hypothetical protein
MTAYIVEKTTVFDYSAAIESKNLCFMHVELTVNQADFYWINLSKECILEHDTV